jgi:uncharacterized protein (TIGR03086 family)
MYSIDDLQDAVANTGRLVDGVSPDQWHAPTPCAEWDLRALVNHMTWVLEMYGAATSGDGPPHPRDSDVLGDDPAGAFRRAAQAAVAGWRARGTDGTVRIPIGELPAQVALGINLTDVYVHGWDVARATGQDAKLDDRLCAELLAFLPDAVPAGARDRAFGPIVDVPAQALASDRLLAYCGRTP